MGGSGENRETELWRDGVGDKVEIDYEDEDENENEDEQRMAKLNRRDAMERREKAPAKW